MTLKIQGSIIQDWEAMHELYNAENVFWISHLMLDPINTFKPIKLCKWYSLNQIHMQRACSFPVWNNSFIWMRFGIFRLKLDRIQFRSQDTSKFIILFAYLRKPPHHVSFFEVFPLKSLYYFIICLEMCPVRNILLSRWAFVW